MPCDLTSDATKVGRGHFWIVLVLFLIPILHRSQITIIQRFKFCAIRSTWVYLAETFPNEWPYMCAVYLGKETFYSGASLIAPGIILTVAHWIK